MILGLHSHKYSHISNIPCCFLANSSKTRNVLPGCSVSCRCQIMDSERPCPHLLWENRMISQKDFDGWAVSMAQRSAPASPDHAGSQSTMRGCLPTQAPLRL